MATNRRSRTSCDPADYTDIPRVLSDTVNSTIPRGPLLPSIENSDPDSLFKWARNVNIAFDEWFDLLDQVLIDNELVNNEVVNVCYCIKLCEGDDPYVPKVYECDAYETALLASPLTDVWLMNDNPGAGVDPVNSKGTLYLDNNLNMATDGPSLIPDTCSTEFSYRPSSAYLRARDPIPATKQLSFTWANGGFGNNRIFIYTYVFSFSWQIAWGGAGIGIGTDSDLVVIVNGRDSGSDPVTQESLIFPNLIPTENGIFTVTIADASTVNVYRNYELVGSQQFTQQIAGDPAWGSNTALDIGGGTNTSWQGSHMGFAPFILSGPDIAALKDGWDRNHIDYVDPTPPSGGPPIFEVGDVLAVSEVDPVTGEATWCPEPAYLIDLCEGPTPVDCSCSAIEDSFALVSGLYALGRGYGTDTTGTSPANGPMNNIAVGTTHDLPFTGSASGVVPTPVGNLGQCNDEGVHTYNGSNNFSQTADFSEYVGLRDDHYQGAIYYPSIEVEGSNSLTEIGMVDLLTFVNSGYAVMWNADTGFMQVLGGGAGTDADWLIDIGTLPEAKGFDDLGNPRWRLITWHIVRTSSSMSITVYVNGVAVGSGVQTEDQDGVLFSNADYWATDDGNAGREPRRFLWMGGYHNGYRSGVGKAIFLHGSGGAFDVSQLQAVGAAIDAQLTTCVQTSPGTSVTFEVGDVLRVSAVDPVTGEATWCPVQSAGYGGVEQVVPTTPAVTITAGTWYTIPTDTAMLDNPLNVLQDEINAGISALIPGVWRVDISLSCGFDPVSGSGARYAYLRLFNITQGAPTSTKTTSITIEKNIEAFNISTSDLFEVPTAAGDLLGIQLGGSSDALDGFTVDGYRLMATLVAEL